MSEIQEAVQIIRVGFEGIEIAMKVGSGGLGAVQKGISFLIALCQQEKTLGKTSMKKLLMRGGDLQVFQFNEEEMKQVKSMAKKYGVLYSVLPDIKKEDGKCEVIFHSEAVPRVNVMIQKLKFGGHIKTFEDYLGDDKNIDTNKLMEFLEKQKVGNHNLHGDVNRTLEGLMEKVGLFAMEKQSINVEEIKEEFHMPKEKAEEVMKQLETIGAVDKVGSDGNHKVLMDKEAFLSRIQKYQELSNRVQQVANSKNKNLVDVTLNKSLIVKENERAIRTRVPGTYGKNIRYLWIEKETCMDIHNGKTILSVLDKEKEYKLYDEKNMVTERVKGSQLYESHYDPVAKQLREQYKKEAREAARKAKEKAKNAAKEVVPTPASAKRGR